MWVIVVWLVFVLTLSSFASEKRIFDSSSLTIESIILKAGENRSLSCPGVNEHSLILALEWFSLTYNVKLVEFMSDSTTVWDNQHRLSLDTKTYGLSFHPALAEDSGDYICLVNSRPKPDGIVRLIVQDVPDPPGRPLIVSFTSRSVNLSWAPSQDTHYSHVIHYIIHIRVGEDGEWNTVNGIKTLTNDSSYQVSELRPYTVYSFRVVAVSAMGASQPSKESYYMVTLREDEAKIGTTSSSIISRINIESDSSKEELDSKLINLEKASCGGSWWIKQKDDNELGHFRPQHSFAESPVQTLVSLRTCSSAADQTSVNYTKTCFENKPNKGEMEVLFKKIIETSSEHKIDTIVEHVQPTRKYTSVSTCLVQKNDSRTNLLIPSETVEEYLSQEKTEALKFEVPWSISSDKASHEIKSNRISRPLSSKYSHEEKDEDSIKNVSRKVSIMDLTTQEDGNNISLSSLYDELCAASTEKKANPNSRRSATPSSVCGVSDVTIPNFGRVSIHGSKSLLQTQSTSGIEITEKKLEGVSMPMKDSKKISTTGICLSSGLTQKSGFISIYSQDNEDDEVQKKRTHRNN